MIIRINFGGGDDEFMACPEEIGTKIEQLREEFLSWLYDETIDHPYWVYAGGEKLGVCYRSDALIFWLGEVKYQERDWEIVLFEPERVEKFDRSIFF